MPTIAVVERQLSTILVAVPAFKRVEPVTTSAPTRGAMTSSANRFASGGGAQVLLARAQLLNGVFGLAIDTTGSTGGVNAVVRNSRIQNNSQDGIVLVGGAPIGLLVDDSAVFANGGNGVRAIGANVTARLSQTAVAGNGTGVAAFSGGLVQSYGNNNIVANGANGTAVKIPTD